MGGDDDYVKESPYERELVEIAERRLAEYQDDYIPLEYQQMRDVERFRSQTFKQGMMDRSVNAARMQTPGTMIALPGLNPGTGGFMMASQAAQQRAGGSSAMGAMAGLQSAEDLYTSGTLDLAAVGRGQTGTGMGMTSTIASQQAGVLSAKKAAEQSIRDSQWGAAGSIAGAATSVYGSKHGWFDKPKKDI